METSASFEARYAPLSYPTEGGERRCCHGRPKRADSVGINRHGVANERVVKKGIAIHLETESCEGVRKGALEALSARGTSTLLNNALLSAHFRIADNR